MQLSPHTGYTVELTIKLICDRAWGVLEGNHALSKELLFMFIKHKSSCYYEIQPELFKVLKIFLVVSSALTTGISSATTINESPEISLHIDKNLISADIYNSTLDTIAKEFTRQANIKFYIPESISGIRLSAKFQRLSLRKAIRNILREENYVMYIPQQTDSRNKSNSNEGIHVYMLSSMYRSYKVEETRSKNISKHNNFIPESQNLSDKAISKLESNPLIENIDYSAVIDISPDSRIEGLHTLVDEQTSDALPIVIGALMDENPNVRMAALKLILDNPIGEIPDDMLSRISRSDENQNVRSLAKKLLTERYEENGHTEERPPE